MSRLPASCTARAPATIANVAVGFDLMGFSIDGPYDEVTARRTTKLGVRIAQITGEVGGTLPRSPSRNTATAGIVQMLKDEHARFGVEVSIRKGIPFGSGLGGSAASAVAGVVAASGLFARSFSQGELLRYALIGERVASGSLHADNAAPCLCGGLVLAPKSAHARSGFEIIELPPPRGIFTVALHPSTVIETKHARAILRKEIALKTWIDQTGHAIAFTSALYERDWARLRSSFQDLVIEPQRAHLIPCFTSLKKLASEHEALGATISGAGPAVFAWVKGKQRAHRLRSRWIRELERRGIAASAWVSATGARGATIVRKD